MIVVELINIVKKEMRDNNIPIESVFEDGSISYQTFKKYRNINEIRDWMENVFFRLHQCLLRLQRLSHFNENTRKAIEYMEGNYHTGISLKDIARDVNINSSYLSRLFKNDTGINVMDYLNKIRIDRSISLIEEGKYPLKEIMFKVGIQNYNYFFKLFKKYTGLTPTDYKYNIESHQDQPVKMV
jgi:two-component system response regulator YesN